MTKKEFVDAIQSNYKYEFLDDKDGMQLFIDDAFVDVAITFNGDDMFTIDIEVYDTFWSAHYGCEKHPDVAVLAYYKSIVIALETKLDDYEAVKSKCFDTNRGTVYTVSYSIREFNIEIIKRLCMVLFSVGKDVNIFDCSEYDQALLEIISNDDDYKDVQFDNGKLVLKPGCAMVFIGDMSSIIPNVDITEFIIADDIYIGVKYAIIKNTAMNRTAVIESKYLRIFNKISDEYEIAELKYYINRSHFVYVESEKLRFVSTAIRIDEVAIVNEYEVLVAQLFELKRIVPMVPFNVTYDFSKLTADNFESLCFDLLDRIGFNDIKRMGTVNAPDGGKDILAVEEYPTLFKIEQRKWVFQCKHSKKSLSKQEIAGISDLLEENKVQGYGLFCSSNLTPYAIALLETKKEKNHIQYYGKSEMTMLIEKHSDLAIKYKLL